MSSVGSSSTDQSSPSFGRLPARALGRPVVGHGGGHHDHVRVGRARAPRAPCPPPSASRRPRCRPAAGPRGSRRAASPRRRAARASSASATPIRPDERLPRKRTASSGSRVPPADDEDARPGSGPRRRRGAPGNGRRSPRARSSAPRRSRPRRARPPRADQLDPRSASSAAFACVAGCSHMRTFIAGATSDRPAKCERRLGEDVVGEPVRELGERVRRQRRDHEQVGLERGAGRAPAGALAARAPRRCARVTNRSASGVSTGVTSCPALTSSRQSSQPCRRRSRR